MALDYGHPVNLTDDEIDALIAYGQDVQEYAQGELAEHHAQAIRKLKAQQNVNISRAVNHLTNSRE